MDKKTKGTIYTEETERVARKYLPAEQLKGRGLFQGFITVMTNDKWRKEIHEGFNARRSEWEEA